MNGWIVAGAAVVAVVVAVNNMPTSKVANGCVLKDEDKEWSFLTFRNKCRDTINVVFCQKFGLGELRRAFGEQQYGDWNCDRKSAGPGQSFATIKWVNDRSSVASWMMSSSQYQFAACSAPSVPHFTTGSKFECR